MIKFSLLIPCYNAERWGVAAIRSALDQTWPDKEMVVLDDGSTNDSTEVIRSFGEAIRFESGPNRGGNAARQQLLEVPDGKWLHYHDADAYLLAQRIERQLGAFDPSPGVLRRHEGRPGGDRLTARGLF